MTTNPNPRPPREVLIVEAARLRAEGLKFREIGKVLGVSKSYAESLVNDPSRAKAKARQAGAGERAKLTDEVCWKAVRAYREFGVAGAAKRLGVDKMTVYNRMEKVGVLERQGQQGRNRRKAPVKVTGTVVAVDSAEPVVFKPELQGSVGLLDRLRQAKEVASDE